MEVQATIVGAQGGNPKEEELMSARPYQVRLAGAGRVLRNSRCCSSLFSGGAAGEGEASKHYSVPGHR